MNGWIAWAQGMFAQVSEKAEPGKPAAACQRGQVYVNEAEGRGGPTSQGFSIRNGTGGIELVSSLCPGKCLGFATSDPKDGASAALVDCSASGAVWEVKP